MNFLIILGLIFLVIVVAGFAVMNDWSGNVDEPKDNLYQGPVPEGYDEEHFRQTGETILIKEVE